MRLIHLIKYLYLLKNIFPSRKKIVSKTRITFATRYPEQMHRANSIPPNYPFIHPLHIIANTRNTIEHHYPRSRSPIHPPNLAWNFTREQGGKGTKANSRLLSSTGEQRVDQRIAKHESDGGQPRVLDSSRPHSSIGTAPFPRRDFNYHLSIHVAEDQGRQGAREGGNRDTGREQSTTGAGTA